MRSRDTDLETTGRMTNAAIRESNRIAVYTRLRREGGLTRGELVRTTGLARPTVDAIVRELLGDELLGESLRPSGRNGGRPSTLLTVRQEARLLATVHYTPAGVETVLGDLGGAVVAHGLASRPADRTDLEAVLDAFEASVDAARHAGPATGTLAAVSLCLPGGVDRGAGLWRPPSTGTAPALPVAHGLADRLGVPVTLANIAAASLVGALTDTGAGGDPAALVYVGRGVGSALLVAGQLVSGAGGWAGEIGHAPVPGVDTLCPCGRRGCVETVASQRAISAEYSRLTGRPAPATLRAMEEEGDPVVDAVLDRAADVLAGAAVWLVDILNPAALLLGGSPFVAGVDRFAKRFESVVRERAHQPNLVGLELGVASPQARIEGGLRLAAELLPPLFRL